MIIVKGEKKRGKKKGYMEIYIQYNDTKKLVHLGTT